MAWMTMAQAAVATGVSVRTIYRRIEAEQLETRREGRHTLVNIDLPQEGMVDSEFAGRHSVPVLAAGRQGGSVDSLSGGSGTDWRDVALETLRDDVSRARGSARNAWVLSAVAVLVLLFGAWRSGAVKSKYADQSGNAAKEHAKEIEAMIVSYEQHLQGVQAESACVIEELNDRINLVERESAGAAASLEASRQANESLQGQVALLGRKLLDAQAELATATADRDLLAEENVGLTEQAAALNERVLTQEKALAELQTQVAIYTDQRDELDGDSTELRRELAERIAEAGQLRGQVAELTDQRDELSMQTVALQQALDAEMELAGMHRGKMEALQAAHDWLVDDVRELRSNLEGARAARSEVERKLEAAEVSLEHMTTERDQLSEQLTGLRRANEKKVAEQQPASEIAKSTIDLAKPSEPAGGASSEMASPQTTDTAEPIESPRRMKITVTEPTTRPASDHRRDRLNPLRRTAFARERRW